MHYDRQAKGRKVGWGLAPEILQRDEAGLMAWCVCLLTLGRGRSSIPASPWPVTPGKHDKWLEAPPQPQARCCSHRLELSPLWLGGDAGLEGPGQGLLLGVSVEPPEPASCPPQSGLAALNAVCWSGWREPEAQGWRHGPGSPGHASMVPEWGLYPTGVARGSSHTVQSGVHTRSLNTHSAV